MSDLAQHAADVAEVIDEAYGRMPTPDWLTADPHRWRDLLVDAVETANEQLRGIAVDESVYKTERRGPDEYRQAMAEFKTKRAKVMHFRRKIEGRLRQVNGLLKADGREIQAAKSDPSLALRRAAKAWMKAFGDTDEQRTLFAVAALDAWNETLSDEETNQ